MPRIGAPELIILLVIILIVFGAGKLPQIGSAIGKSLHEFRKSSHNEDSEAKAEVKKTEATLASPPDKK